MDELFDRVTEGTKEQPSTPRLIETRHDKKVYCKMKCKYVTNREEERNMTDECQPVSKAKYTTMEDTAHRTESKQVDEEQHHPLAKQLSYQYNTCMPTKF